MDRITHWNQVYETKAPDQVSWYQASPERSLAMVRALAPSAARVLDIGGGASSLVDALLKAGYPRPILLDVAAAGLAHARRRLGPRAAEVEWVVADVTMRPPLPAVDLWHDRAVLHFLVEPADQAAYASLVRDTVVVGGHVILATFAPDGPEKCSGLPVQRHDGASLTQLLGTGFLLLGEEREVHLTPSGGEQRFTWAWFRRTLSG